MNKNIIKLGLLFGTSVMADMSFLTIPTIDTYSDNLVQKVNSESGKMSLTQISQIQNRMLYADASTSVRSQAVGVSIVSTLSVQLDDVAILTSVVERIQNSKPLDEEFANIIDDNFFDLI